MPGAPLLAERPPRAPAARRSSPARGALLGRSGRLCASLLGAAAPLLSPQLRLRPLLPHSGSFRGLLVAPPALLWVRVPHVQAVLLPRDRDLESLP